MDKVNEYSDTLQEVEVLYPGTIIESEKQPFLQQIIVQVPIVSESECRAKNPGVTVDMLCAGGEQGKDACQVSTPSHHHPGL